MAHDGSPVMDCFNFDFCERESGRADVSWHQTRARPRGDCAFVLMFLFIVQFVRKEKYNLLDTPVVLPFFLFRVEENIALWDPLWSSSNRL